MFDLSEEDKHRACCELYGVFGSVFICPIGQSFGEAVCGRLGQMNGLFWILEGAGGVDWLDGCRDLGLPRVEEKGAEIRWSDWFIC